MKDILLMLLYKIKKTQHKWEGGRRGISFNKSGITNCVLFCISSNLFVFSQELLPFSTFSLTLLLLGGHPTTPSTAAVKEQPKILLKKTRTKVLLSTPTYSLRHHYLMVGWIMVIKCGKMLFVGI